jgi:DNA-binding transcriptional ArsR family regulator
MSRWFRVYDDLVDDPKVQRLPGETVKSLLNLWCLASQNDGMLPAADDIAFKLRMTPSKVAKLLSVLGECGLIDSDEEGLRPHNWNARQYKSDVADPTAALRQKAYRERNKNRDGDRNDTVTVTDTRTETEQIQNAAHAAPDPEVELFNRGRQVLGKQAGGMISKLLAAKQKNVALARAAIEQASTKSDPREYVGAVIRGQQKAAEPNWLDGIEGVI